MAPPRVVNIIIIRSFRRDFPRIIVLNIRSTSRFVHISRAMSIMSKHGNSEDHTTNIKTTEYETTKRLRFHGKTNFTTIRMSQVTTNSDFCVSIMLLARDLNFLLLASNVPSDERIGHVYTNSLFRLPHLIRHYTNLQHDRRNFTTIRMSRFQTILAGSNGTQHNEFHASYVTKGITILLISIMALVYPNRHVENDIHRLFMYLLSAERRTLYTISGTLGNKLYTLRNLIIRIRINRAINCILHSLIRNVTRTNF